MGSQHSDPHGKRQTPTQQGMDVNEVDPNIIRPGDSAEARQRPKEQGTAVSETPYEQVDVNIMRPGDSIEARQMPNQQGTYIGVRPNQHYETITESDPQYTRAYNTGFDHYDSPANIARDYEIPLPLTVETESSSQEMDETEQALAGTGKI